MDHLHVVTRPSFTNPVAAGLAVGLSRSFLEDLLDGWPSSGGSARHEGRTIPRPLLTTGNSGADEQQTLRFELLRATDGIGVVGVATVNNDVTFLEVRLELFDEIVDRGSSLDEKDDFPGPLQFRD